MNKSHIPKKLWDYFLKLEGLIHYHTELDIFKLEGEVTETKLMGDKAGISIIADNACYYWIKIYDPVGKQIPEENMYL